MNPDQYQARVRELYEKLEANPDSRVAAFVRAADHAFAELVEAGRAGASGSDSSGSLSDPE